VRSARPKKRINTSLIVRLRAVCVPLDLFEPEPPITSPSHRPCLAEPEVADKSPDCAVVHAQRRGSRL